MQRVPARLLPPPGGLERGRAPTRHSFAPVRRPAGGGVALDGRTQVAASSGRCASRLRARRKETY